MAQMSITISDALAAKITAHWGDNAAWKQWVKDTTREQLRAAQIRQAQEDANADLRAAIEQIEAADAADQG